MKLANLRIDRFGARSQLTLDGLSPGLNVIHGPNGSGKSTIINFIRWMLYGNQHEIARYLPKETPASGTMVVADADGHRTLTRRDDALAGGRTPVVGGVNSYAATEATISWPEFNATFCFGFDRAPDISHLVATAISSGFRLERDERQEDRIRQLSDQLARYRIESERLRVGDVSHDLLQRRRADKMSEIDQILRARQHRRVELDRQRAELTVQTAERARQVEHHRAAVNRLEAAIDERRRSNLEAEHRWQDTRREMVSREQQKLAELDGQITHWQDVRSGIRDRLDQLRNRIQSLSDVVRDGGKEVNLRIFLRTLGFRSHLLDLGELREAEDWPDHEADPAYLNGLVHSAVAAMRDDISRLCAACDDQMHAAELRDYREELDQLVRCEHELSRLVEGLSHRQKDILAVANDPTTTPNVSNGVTERQDFSTPLATVPAIHNFRLQQLNARSESAQARLRDAEADHADLLRRLSDLDAQANSLADDETLTALRRDVADIEARMAALVRQQKIDRQMRVIEAEIQAIRGQLRQGQVVEEASRMLSKFTVGRYSRVHLGPGHQVLVEDQSSHKIDSHQLSRGIQDQLYLSFAFALVEAYRRRNVELPLVLNDAFVNIDSSGAAAIAGTLQDLVRHGHQVLVFSRHEHIMDLFRSRDARLFSLRQRAQVDLSTSRTLSFDASYPNPRSTSEFTRSSFVSPPVAEVPPPVAPDPTYRWVAEWHSRTEQETVPESPARSEPDEAPPETDSVASPRFGDDRPLESIPTLDGELIEYLAEIGVYRVNQFLAMVPAEAEARLRSYGIDAETIERRQREALLQCFVGVTADESRLLVACGVADPERLARADEAVLFRRIETILKNAEARERFGTPAMFGGGRIRTWIQAAERSGYRAATQRRSVYQSAKRAVPQARDVEPKLRSERAELSRSRVEPPRQSTVPLHDSRPLRFYLETTDPVVDAPSIGPKTAEKLQQVGIISVGDLLNADAAAVAIGLDDRRIDGETILTWQVQARLVCRIPNLRGHDAQILVACDVTDPQMLAEQNAQKLHKHVTRFVNTNDGKRVLRNGKQPDLQEVADWIEWARSARQLRAA